MNVLTPDCSGPTSRSSCSSRSCRRSSASSSCSPSAGSWASCRRGWAPTASGRRALLQGLADLVKLVTKEDITPAQAEKAVHFLAPVLAVIPALTALAVIPFGPPVRIGQDHDAALGGRHQHRPALPARDHLDRRLRDHPRRLGVEQQVLAARRAALRGAAGLVRGADGPRARVGAADDRGSLSLVEIVRRQEAHAPLVRLPGDGRLLHLLRRGCRGDQPQPVRPAGGRVRARGGLQHRVLRRASSPSSSWASTRR